MWSIRSAIKIITIGIVAGIGVFFLFSANPFSLQTDAADDNANAPAPEEKAQGLIGGWAWNQTLGWVSQRHVIRDEATQERIGEFGVVKYDGGKDNKGKGLPDEIEGWSWSSVYGFICWGSTCSTLCTRDEKKAGKCPTPDEVRSLGGSTVPPGGGTSYATISKTATSTLIGFGKNQTTQDLYQVQGWAKIIQLKDLGWIQLSECSIKLEPGELCPLDKQKFGIHFDDVTNEFRGWAWNNNLGWFAFSGKTLYDTPYSYAIEYADDEKKTVKARYEIRVHPGTGEPVVFLPNEQISIDEAEKRGLKIVLDASACLNQTLCKDVGFIETVGKSPWRTQYVGPRIETSGGTAFSREGFDLGDIDFADEAFTGEFKDKQGVLQPGKIVGSTRLEKKRRDSNKKAPGKNPPPADPKRDRRESALRIEFPAQASKDKNKLISALGTLNKLALTTLSPRDGVKNKYGYEVVNFNQIEFGGVTNHLKGKIHLYKPAISGPGQVLQIGSVTDRAPHTIMNSLNNTTSGAGTIVAYGADIHFYAPIRYDQTALSSPPLSRLASVAWIALKDDKGNGGNIIIDDCIPPFLRPDNKGYFTSVSVDGLFFAEGTIETRSGDGKKCIKEIDTIPGLTAAQKTELKKPFRSAISDIDIPLSVEGSMIANTFSFGRVYGGYDQGSEDIIDTGRAQINPPPGITDIVRSLPVK